MDTYTKETKIWLEDRFKECDETGIYLAHEPIYGYRKGHHDLDPAFACACTYQIMRAFSRLIFDSLLDVNGAEGYKASIAKQLFGIKVVNSDLSEEACKRAEEIHDIKSSPANIQDLPFKDNEYDVILCSAHSTSKCNLDRRQKRQAAVASVHRDNGKEFSCHKEVAASLEASMYFAHPYASWERGLNDNTNGLIRQYFPRKHDFAAITDDQIRKVTERLNHRPRKKLGFKTPYEVFFKTSTLLTVALQS